MTYIDIIWIFFILYFSVFYLGHLFLNIVAIVSVSRHMKGRVAGAVPLEFSYFEPPISVIVPAYNEETIISGSIRSLLQLSYSEYEVIVVNDGSSDKTLDVLIEEFSLEPFPETYRILLPTMPLRGIYRSKVHPGLRVLDKENGSKADAINAGINASRYPLFCAVDADSVLMRDSLVRVVEPFLDDATTVSAGGTIRIANGCEVREGFLLKVGLPKNLLALFQIIEYLRAFLFGRIGWSAANMLLLVSGAFGLFRKAEVVAAGGYRTDTVGEDMELVVRLHRHMRERSRPYKITYVPDPICWTEVPEDIMTLMNQRVRWQRGLSESLTMNMGLLFHRRGGAVGWLAFPFYIIFEWLGPFVEIAGYLFTAFAYAMGFLSPEAFITFFIVAMGFGVLLSVTTILIEQISFHVYQKISHILLLSFLAVVENLGYRQINSVWRLWGLLKWMFGRKSGWGKMKRRGTWQRK